MNIELVVRRFKECGFDAKAQKLTREEALWISSNTNTWAEHFTPIFKQLVKFPIRHSKIFFGGYHNDNYFSNSYYRTMAWSREAVMFYLRIDNKKYVVGVNLENDHNYKARDIMDLCVNIANGKELSSILFLTLSMGISGLFTDALRALSNEQFLDVETELLDICAESEDKSEFVAALLEEKNRRGLFVNASGMEL